MNTTHKSRTITGELVSVGSHSVTIDRGHREELFPVLRSEWRGETVTVKMEANRYEHSSGLSEWRIYAREVRYGTDAYSGAVATETARSRMSEALAPIVAAWLDSDAYRASRRAAFYRAIRSELRDARIYLDDQPARHARTELRKHRAELSDEQAAAIEQAADALDAFARTFNGTADLS